MNKLPEISLECHGYRFSANWTDETHRYHVWVWLDFIPDPYQVNVDSVIHKNPLVSKRPRVNDHRALDLYAARYANIKAEIERLAKPDELLAMRVKMEAEERAIDEMRADADRLNRIYDAWVLPKTKEDLIILGLM